MRSPLNHWEITVSDGEKSKEFFAKVFGWTFDEESVPGVILIRSGKGPKGRIRIKSRKGGSCGIRQFFEVDDIDETLRRVKQAGGKILERKKVVPRFGQYAAIQDRDRTCYGIFCQKF